LHRVLQQFTEHMNGKPHKKKEKAVAIASSLSASGVKMTSDVAVKIGSKLTGPSAYFCEVCNISCSGPDVLKSHLAGARHTKVRTYLCMVIIIGLTSTSPCRRGCRHRFSLLAPNAPAGPWTVLPNVHQGLWGHGAKFYIEWPSWLNPVWHTKTGLGLAFGASTRLQGTESNDCLFDSTVTV